MAATKLGIARINKEGRSIWHTLPEGAGQCWTRLFLLSPGIANDPLQGHLELVCVSERISRPFEAISYVWGMPPFVGTVLIGTRPLAISMNLEQALRHLRLPDIERALWVDAICIDQEDGDEKTQQVGQLAKVFGAARHVYCWLSPPIDSLEQTAIILERLAKEEEEASQPIIQPLTDPWHRSALRNLAELKMCTDFLSNPYFGRAWVVQEVLKAKSATLLAPNFSMTWPIFARAVLVLHRQAFADFRALRNSFSVVLTAYSVLKGNRLSLKNTHSLLWAFRARQATDPRDKIFAFVGLDSKPSSSIQPDYRKDVQELYMDVMVHCLRQDDSLVLFSLKPNINALHNLPSWVVDWSYNSGVDNVGNWHEYAVWRDDSAFQATKGHVRDSINRQGTQLTVSGFFIDELLITSPAGAVSAFLSKVQTSQGDNVSSLVENSSWLRKLFHELDTLFVQTQPMFRLLSIESQSRVFFEKHWSHSKYSFGVPQDQIYWRTLFIYDKAYFRTQFGPDLDELHLALLYSWIKWCFAPLRLAVKLGLIRFGVLLVAISYFSLALFNWARQRKKIPRQFASPWPLMRFYERRFAWTTSGFWTNGPARAEVGDKIALIAGGPVPYLLRPRSPTHYELIGDIYVHGFMYGEFWYPEKCHDILLV